MPAEKIVRTRTAGWCDREFAHPGQINAGDRVRVTTYFPSDEAVRDFGVREFQRSRTCQWCVEREEVDAAQRAEWATRTAPHDPCCSSHGVTMTCEQYRRTHFVEVRPCCARDAQLLATPTETGDPS